MGEIADAMINGELDSLTGEYLGKGCGYPRTREKRRFVPMSYKQKVLTVMWTDTPKGNPHNVSFIQIDQMIEEYVHGVLKLPQEIKESTACKHILRNPIQFKEWFKSKYPHLHN